MAWHTYKNKDSIKIDVMQCMDFLAKGLRVWELPVQTLAASSPCHMAGEMKDEKHQGWELRLLSFPLSCLLLGLSLVKEKKKKTTKTTQQQKTQLHLGFYINVLLHFNSFTSWQH